MNTTKLIAKHYKEIIFGGNWTYSNLKEHLEDVTWEQATKRVESFNTIAALTYHINYYVIGAIDVLQGKPLLIKDKYSFDHPSIKSETDWNKIKDSLFNDANKFTNLVEKLPDSKLPEIFENKKWGNYYRNLHGIIEHAHYHLGQIVLVKKLTA